MQMNLQNIRINKWSEPDYYMAIDAWKLTVFLYIGNKQIEIENNFTQ